MSVHQSSDTNDSKPLEFGGNFNQNITRRATIRNRPTRRSRVDRYDRETEDDSELNENIGNHPRSTTHFPFGMTQTPFQVMSNWSLKFRNNKEDIPAHFLDDLKRFKSGYQKSRRDILENLDALLTEDANDWCLININSWRTLSDFFREFTRTYIDEKFLEEIEQKMKFCNQKRNQDIHPYLIEITKLFTKLDHRRSLEWELCRAYEILRIKYKMYIKRNDFDTFEELQDVRTIKIFFVPLLTNKTRLTLIRHTNINMHIVFSRMNRLQRCWWCQNEIAEAAMAERAKNCLAVEWVAPCSQNVDVNGPTMDPTSSWLLPRSTAIS